MRLSCIDKPVSLQFDVTNVEQVLMVRQFLLEVAFEHIREGANPFDIFSILELQVANALVGIMSNVDQTITVDLNLFE